MTAADFRRIALSFQGVEAGSHMGATDFRIGGRIFATLAHEAQGYGNLMLSPELQAGFVSDAAEVFLPVAGGWGRLGATHVRLEATDEPVLRGALQTAWEYRLQANAAPGRKAKPKAAAKSAKAH